jgi:alpha-N-acetylglucosaminidase
MDRLLATRRDFLLGKWVSDARKCGSTEAEKALYEQNAKNLVTLWGDENSPLHEYSNRQWSGLLSDFYKPRWQQFFQKVEQSLENGQTFDAAAFEKEIKAWEWRWVTARKDYPVAPAGRATEVAKSLYDKYRQAIDDSYK